MVWQGRLGPEGRASGQWPRVNEAQVARPVADAMTFGISQWEPPTRL